MSAVEFLVLHTGWRICNSYDLLEGNVVKYLRGKLVYLFFTAKFLKLFYEYLTHQLNISNFITGLELRFSASNQVF